MILTEESCQMEEYSINAVQGDDSLQYVLYLIQICMNIVNEYCDEWENTSYCGRLRSRERQNNYIPHLSLTMLSHVCVIKLVSERI